MFENYNNEFEYRQLSEEEKFVFDLKQIQNYARSHSEGRLEYVETKIDCLINLLIEHFDI
jgi:hypothetical protein